jgi:undecaprenyl-diphosphatase
LEIFKYIILGIIQGLTEFLPVSSSGHLVLIPFILKWNYIPVYFAVILHVATLISIIIVFYKDIWFIILNFFKGLFIKEKRKNKYFKLALYIIVASIPAVIAGFFFEKQVESFFTKPLYVAIFLILTAILLVSSEYYGKKIEKKQMNHSGSRLNIPNSFIIGIGQAIAIFPGLSRSGSTISFARFFGIKREECVRFSFLLSIPAIFGAFIFEIFKSGDFVANLQPRDWTGMTIGFIFASITGFFAIKFLMVLTKKRNLNFFALYCFIVAIIVFILIAANKF